MLCLINTSTYVLYKLLDNKDNEDKNAMTVCFFTVQIELILC